MRLVRLLPAVAMGLTVSVLAQACSPSSPPTLTVLYKGKTAPPTVPAGSTISAKLTQVGYSGRAFVVIEISTNDKTWTTLGHVPLNIPKGAHVSFTVGKLTHAGYYKFIVSLSSNPSNTNLQAMSTTIRVEPRSTGPVSPTTNWTTATTGWAKNAHEMKIWKFRVYGGVIFQFASSAPPLIPPNYSVMLLSLQARGSSQWHITRDVVPLLHATLTDGTPLLTASVAPSFTLSTTSVEVKPSSGDVGGALYPTASAFDEEIEFLLPDTAVQPNVHWQLVLVEVNNDGTEPSATITLPSLVVDKGQVP